MFNPLLALQDVIWRPRQSVSYLLKGRCIMSCLNPSLILMLSYTTGHIYENELQTHKRLKTKTTTTKKRYLLGQNHNLQIFGVIPFVKLQH